MHLLLGHSFFLPSLLHLLPSKFSASSQAEAIHSTPLLSFSVLGSLSLCGPKSPHSPCATSPRNSASTDSPKLSLGPNAPCYLCFGLSQHKWCAKGIRRDAEMWGLTMMGFLESISSTGHKAELGSGTIILVWGDPPPSPWAGTFLVRFGFVAPQ